MNRWLLASISPLLPVIILSAALNSQCFAEVGRVYPDTARVEFSWEQNQDTVIITVNNLSADSLTNFVISDHTDSAATFIECTIDGLNIETLPSEQSFGEIIPNKFTTRWLINDFYESMTLKYRCGSYRGFSLTFYAGHPYPIFGIASGIGPPFGPGWWQ